MQKSRVGAGWNRPVERALMVVPAALAALAGLSTSTFVTLIVIPALFVWVATPIAKLRAVPILTNPTEVTRT